MKRGLNLLNAAAVLLLVLLIGCGAPESTGTAGTSASPAAGTEIQLTLDELAKYNGQDGNPAYIAVDGVIYDVTNVPQWKGGSHMGNLAGADVTNVLKSSPHGAAKLKEATVVGTVTGG